MAMHKESGTLGPYSSIFWVIFVYFLGCFFFFGSVAVRYRSQVLVKEDRARGASRRGGNGRLWMEEEGEKKIYGLATVISYYRIGAKSSNDPWWFFWKMVVSWGCR